MYSTPINSLIESLDCKIVSKSYSWHSLAYNPPSKGKDFWTKRWCVVKCVSFAIGSYKSSSCCTISYRKQNEWKNGVKNNFWVLLTILFVLQFDSLYLQCGLCLLFDIFTQAKRLVILKKIFIAVRSASAFYAARILSVCHMKSRFHMFSGICTVIFFFIIIFIRRRGDDLKVL